MEYFDFYTEEHVNNLQRYIEENFALDGTSRHLIRNILDYVAGNVEDEQSQIIILLDLLNGIGIDERDLRKGVK